MPSTAVTASVTVRHNAPSLPRPSRGCGHHRVSQCRTHD